MNRTRCLVIGLDAAEPELLRAGALDGSLPNLARLMETSACGHIEPPPGQYAGSIWPSIHTGCTPARHGRYFFQQLVPGTYDIRPFPPEDLKAPPFWHALAQAGKRVAVIDVPKAPIVEPFDGVQLLDWGAHDPEFPEPRSYPANLKSDIEARFGRDPVGTCDRAIRENPRRLRDDLIARIDTKRAIVEHVLDQGPWDLTMAVFAESHCAGHQFWHVRDPEHPNHDAALAAELGDPVIDIYRALDRAVGELTAKLDPDTRLLVFTSHGMGAHYDATFLLKDILYRLHASAGTRSGRPVEALRWLWRKLPRTWRRGSLAAVSPVKRSVDTAEMRDRDYFAVPTNDNCGGIRINLEGREPHGRVAPGEHYERVCAALSADLLALENAETGEPVVREVLRTDAVFAGKYLHHLPDLNVVWNQEQPIRSVRSDKIGTLSRAYEGHRSGDHRPHGFYLLRDPAVSIDSRDGIAAEDLAPTVCAWLGVDLDADGTPLAVGPLPERAPGKAAAGIAPSNSASIK